MTANDTIDGLGMAHRPSASLFSGMWLAEAARAFPLRLPRPRSPRQRDRAIAAVNAAFILLILALVGAGLENRPEMDTLVLERAAPSPPAAPIMTEHASR